MEFNETQLTKRTYKNQTCIMLSDSDVILLDKLVESLRGTKSQIFRLGLKLVNESLLLKNQSDKNAIAT